MAIQKIYESKRNTAWPAPEGSHVTVTATSTDGSAVHLKWQRDDLAERGVPAESLTLTRAEFDGIARALAAMN